MRPRRCAAPKGESRLAQADRRPLALRRLDAADPGFDRELAALIAFEAAQDPAVDAAVAAIVADVRARGDAALLEYTARFDGVDAPSVAALEIAAAEMRRAFDALPDAQRAALRAPRRASARTTSGRRSRRGRTATRTAASSASRSRRSTASASTCPAARPRIRRRC